MLVVMGQISNLQEQPSCPSVGMSLGPKGMPQLASSTAQWQGPLLGQLNVAKPPLCTRKQLHLQSMGSGTGSLYVYTTYIPAVICIL